MFSEMYAPTINMTLHHDQIQVSILEQKFRNCTTCRCTGKINVKHMFVYNMLGQEY